jgi:TRAP-type C4-dicarboxylate transport system permease small subunit
MTLKERYSQAMEQLYIVCVFVSGVALVLITLVIPYGVFMRYVMNSASSWPEPFSVVMMVAFSFIGGAAVYRAGAHMAVVALLDKLNPPTRRVFGWIIDACLVFFCGFMVWKGTDLVMAMMHQTIPEFPTLPVGVVYMPIPICGAILLLFIVERIWCGEPPKTSIMFRDDPEALE